METITIKASVTYEVLADSELIEKSGVLIRKALGNETKKVCVVTDDKVDLLYRRPLVRSLEKADFDTSEFVFKAGEKSKNMETVSELLEYLAEKEFTRSDALIALGGGVTGDLTGYAAASYLRGIKFVQVPTTLLAAVDSSAGGKTGVNLRAGKNLAGAFWQPSLVLFDIDTIKSLPYDEVLNGAAEVIKAGVISDRTLFSNINDCEDLTDKYVIKEISRRAIEIKKEVVEKDEHDKGERQLLNFGHTIGHAIEACSDFNISHGHAVAMGMVIISKAAHRFGWSDEDCATPISESLKKLGFSIECPYSAAELAGAALKDKKRKGDIITLVIPVSLGNCRLKKIPVDKLEEVIEEGLK